MEIHLIVILLRVKREGRYHSHICMVNMRLVSLGLV